MFVVDVFEEFQISDLKFDLVKSTARKVPIEKLAALSQMRTTALLDRFYCKLIEIMVEEEQGNYL